MPLSKVGIDKVGIDEEGINPVSELLDCKTVTGSVNSEVFCTEGSPSSLDAFDGKNPHSVVVMDNCSIHHVPFTMFPGLLK